jgi:hypothetical protein
MMTAMHRTRALFFCAALLGPAAPAAAAEPAPKTAQLVYTRGDIASCPDEDAMKSAVAIRLGYDPFKPDPAQIVTAAITREPGGLRGQVDLRDRSFKVKGSRTLTTNKSDCTELASAMALAISIAIDPLSVTRPEPPQQPTAPEPAAAPPPATQAAPERPRDEGPREPAKPVGLRVGVTGGAAFGATPGASFSPSVFAGVAYGAFSIDAEGRGHFTSSVPAQPRGAVEASLLVFMLAPCFHYKVALGCALVGVGSLSGTGTGVDVPESASTLYANAGARLGAEIPLGGPVALRVGGDVLLPLVSTRLRLRGVDVWTSPAVTAALGAGVLASFP